MRVAVILMLVSYVYGGPATESYKDQYCTDPRTMKKHAAYTEWADAYSCTRHRCQPGGRNLAIYTVGCKRVEAPESAIECEEVVEDTNMQFPYCCTRLRDARVDLNFVPVDDMIFGLVGTDFQYISRCLVVVRGEVWTRVLGQPWEVLPAAPWSHMYKMKKPPPGDTTFLSKTPEQGPVYELAEPEKQTPREKVLRASKDTTEAPDCNEVVPRAVPAPDIVIALSTSNDKKERKKKEHPRHKRVRKTSQISSTIFNDEHDNQELSDGDDTTSATEKSSEPHSGERFRGGAFGVTQRVPKVQHHQVAWTEIPQNEWHEHETPVDPETPKDTQDSPVQDNEKKEEKPSNLQALVDAIGTRMRDIEHVVQRMSEKVHHEKPADTEATSAEKRSSTETRNHHKDGNKEMGKAKKPSPDAENYKRFSVRNRGSKYVHGTSDSTTEQPLFVEDTNMNGYFSDASNSVLRRVNPPKHGKMSALCLMVSRVQSKNNGDHQVTHYLSPVAAVIPACEKLDMHSLIPKRDPQKRINMTGFFAIYMVVESQSDCKTWYPLSPLPRSLFNRVHHVQEPAGVYMAPVETRRKTPAHILVSDSSDEGDKKRKKHTHKKKRGKGHTHRKHHKDDKRKHFNKLTSVEIDKNAVSLEDSSAVASK